MIEAIGVLAFIGIVGYILFKMTTKRETFEQAVQETVQEVKATEAKVAEAVKCGCGRSPTGFCIGLHKLTADEWAKHPDNPVKAVVEAVAAEVKAEVAAVEAKVEAAVQKVKKARKPRKKKGE